jgi:hypothetical protein
MIKGLTISASLLLLAGCDCQVAGSQSEQAAATPSVVGVPKNGEHYYRVEDERYYPPSQYGSFPAIVQILMRHADMDSDQCRGVPVDYGEMLRACNRRDRIMIKIEELGYCWGSEKRDPIGADNHWLKCADDPNYLPDQSKITYQPYTEQEIAEGRTLYKSAQNKAEVR